MFEDLRGQVALVTGGARGLGLAIAGTLAECGVSVALADLLPEVEDSAKRLAVDASVPTTAVSVDVTDAGQVADMVRHASVTLGTPTILVNSAGISLDAAALDMRLDQWSRVLDVNLTGTFLACQAFARALVDAGQGGSVINIASMSGRIVNVPQRQSAYNASKAGVEALTKSLAIEWLEHGIRVNAISPGYILSDMTRDFVADHPEMAAAWRSRIPAGDLGRPEDLGGAVAYLASAASRYVVGQCLVIDGGYTIV